MELTVVGAVWWWRGPSPYHFVTVSDDDADQLKAISAQVSYGWGMIPVEGAVGDTAFTTSLWPKNGSFVVPLKDAVRAAEGIELGDVVTIELRVVPRTSRSR
jgi:hypothetical protein